jgi:sporulation protein YlmC with PRC-barrel domain
MDEGMPVAYPVLEKGVPVLGSDGEQVGTVHHVVAAPEQDIFHGLVITTNGGERRFVEAANVESLHEHGVDLRIDSSAAHSLPVPGGAAPVYDEDPAAQTKWSHLFRKYTGRSDWHRRS